MTLRKTVLYTQMASIMNSTTGTTLDPDEYWNNTTPNEDIKTHASVVVSVRTDMPSAQDGLECRWSIDKQNWDFVDAFTVCAGDPATTVSGNILTKTVNVEHRARYFGVRYKNGPDATATNQFRLQSVHKTMPQSLVVENTVETESVTKGSDTGGNYRTIATDPSGHIKVKVLNDYHLDIAQGLVDDKQTWMLSGYNTRVNDIANPVWNSQRSLTDTVLTDVCAQYINIVAHSPLDQGNDLGARTVIVTGVDASWGLIRETVSLSGLTTVTNKQYFRVNNLEVGETGSYFGRNQGLIEAVGATSGKLAAVMNTLDSVSQQLLYAVPQDKVLYINAMHFNSHVRRDASASVNDDSITLRLCVREGGDNTVSYAPVKVLYTVKGNSDVELRQYIQIPPKTDVFVTAQYTPDPDGLAFTSIYHGDYDYQFGSTYTVPMFIVHGSLAGYLVNNSTYLSQETGYEIVDEDHVR